MGFHSYPGGFRVGGTYLCEHVVSLDEGLRFVAVESSDPERFTREAKRDPNVRYVEDAGAGGTAR